MNQIIIEEEKLQHNINTIKEQAQKSESKKPPKIIAVLKGNGYGLGYDILAQKLLENGIDFFAVSEVDEALLLRNLGLTNEILVLNSTSVYEELRNAIKNDLTITIGSFEAFEMAEKVSKEENKKVNAHLKIDTGFSRFGFDAKTICGLINEKIDLAEALKDAINSSKNINITGVYTHFQESYSNTDKRTKEQFELFCKATNILEEKKIYLGIKHCCNSSAFFKYPYMYLDAVRIGSAFTGRLQISNDTGLKKLGYLESTICDIKYLPKGSKIGYSGICKLCKDTKVAIVEAGYSDGFGVTGPRDSVRLIDKLRKLKGILIDFTKNCNIYVRVNDKKAKVLGRIGMKNFTIDVSNIDCKVSDKVRIDISITLCNQAVPRLLK